jgi:hypothetical protein
MDTVSEEPFGEEPLGMTGVMPPALPHDNSMCNMKGT